MISYIYPFVNSFFTKNFKKSNDFSTALDVYISTFYFSYLTSFFAVKMLD